MADQLTMDSTIAEYMEEHLQRMHRTHVVTCVQV